MVLDVAGIQARQLGVEVAGLGDRDLSRDRCSSRSSKQVTLSGRRCRAGDDEPGRRIHCAFDHKRQQTASVPRTDQEDAPSRLAGRRTVSRDMRRVYSALTTDKRDRPAGISWI